MSDTEGGTMGEYGIVDILGWVGAAAVLFAYWMISTHRVTATSAKYQLLNLAGGALLALNSGYYRAFPSALVNIIWIGIAIYSLRKAA